MGIYGQDWASYQPAQPDTTGLSFAIIKVTEGLGYTSPVWQQQRDHARANGLVVGYYHYPHMANSPQAEADRFLSIAKPQPGEIVALDWEGYDSANTGVSHATQLAYKEAWLRYVKGKLPGLPIGMYCNGDYWNNIDTTGYYGDFLWIAVDGPAGQPTTRANWFIHQYGEPNGVDLDYCRLNSTAELRAWSLSFTPQPPAPTPPPEDIVTPQDIQDIAAAVWNYGVPDWGLDANGKPAALGTGKAAYWHLIWNDVFAAQQQAMMQQILAATEASKLTPAQIAQALTDGTLKVQISVAPAVTPA